MLLNLTTKKRLLLNLLLTQLGFAIISIVAILSEYKIAAIITVNIIFAIVTTYLTIYSINRFPYITDIWFRVKSTFNGAF